MSNTICIRTFLCPLCVCFILLSFFTSLYVLWRCNLSSLVFIVRCPMSQTYRKGGFLICWSNRSLFLQQFFQLCVITVVQSLQIKPYMKSSVLLDVILCILLEVNWYFGGPCDLQMKGAYMFLWSCSCLSVDCMFLWSCSCLSVDCMFLWSCSWLSVDCMFLWSCSCLSVDCMFLW
jgi:hypothetical protein